MARSTIMKKKPKLKEYVWYHPLFGIMFVLALRPDPGYEDREHDLYIEKTKLLDTVIYLGGL